jgi:ribonuclease P protein component
MSKKFTLRKEERIKSQKQTELLFSEGRRFTLAPFRIYYTLVKPGKTSLQFGVGVSKKNFKKAVDRNRIKRLVREAYRLQKITLQDKSVERQYGLTIFFIYTSKELPAFKEVYEKTGKVIDKLTAILSETI